MVAPAPTSPNPAAKTQVSQRQPRRRNAPPSASSAAEQEGFAYFERLLAYIKTKNGRFVKEADGALLVLIEGRAIPLTNSPDNLQLSGLMVDACNVSTLLVGARIAIQRLQVHATKEASKIRTRMFSATSEEGGRIYLPTANDTLLRVSADAIDVVQNIENQDSIWVRHPKDAAFRYAQTDASRGVALFEELLVNTQACRIPELSWFVAMHEGLFPFVRDISSCRALVVHVGKSQQGKTSGAERFLLLHGLGKVTGNTSVAALRNEPDPGLLVLDNREHANLTNELIEHLLFLSTGAESKRSRSDGSMRIGEKTRPVTVITSIEGVFKTELRLRCAEVEYSVVGEKSEREQVEQRIVESRHEINSALVAVLQRFLAIQQLKIACPNPFDGNFGVHFRALCNLLRAFAELAAKPTGWAEDLIQAWDYHLRLNASNEVETSELEFPIRRILEDTSANPIRSLDVTEETAVHDGRPGRIYKTTCAWMLEQLQRRPGTQVNALPRSPSALSRRLASDRFVSFVFLGTVNRTASSKKVGFFFPNDESDAK
jgi:hypothetical protein